MKFHYVVACQCNGHSNCTLRRRSPEWNIEERSCTQCDHNTTGEHCQFCADGFYGDPRNGEDVKVKFFHSKNCQHLIVRS